MSGVIRHHSSIRRPLFGFERNNRSRRLICLDAHHCSLSSKATPISSTRCRAFLAGSRRISAKTVAKQPQRTELRPPRATLLLSRPPAPYRERQEDQHHSDCCPKEERVLRAPWSRVIALGDRCSIKGSQRGPRAKGDNHLRPCCARAARRRLMRSSTSLWS